MDWVISIPLGLALLVATGGAAYVVWRLLIWLAGYAEDRWSPDWEAVIFGVFVLVMAGLLLFAAAAISHEHLLPWLREELQTGAASIC